MLSIKRIIFLLCLLPSILFSQDLKIGYIDYALMADSCNFINRIEEIKNGISHKRYPSIENRLEEYKEIEEEVLHKLKTSCGASEFYYDSLTNLIENEERELAIFIKTFEGITNKRMKSIDKVRRNFIEDELENITLKLEYDLVIDANLILYKSNKTDLYNLTYKLIGNLNNITDEVVFEKIDELNKEMDIELLDVMD